MRLGFGLLALGLCAATACTDDPAARVAAEWGCAPIAGLGGLKGPDRPTWLLVGEATETAEAPAAVAALACHLAADGRTLFVGVSQYLGGDTDAEADMLAALADLAGKGAPLVVERIDAGDNAHAVPDRSASEKDWADALAARVSAAGAEQAILLLARAEAATTAFAPQGERFAGYSPMPTFLPGRVVSLEVVADASVAADAPAIRIRNAPVAGFHGELAFNRLTRPSLPIVYPPPPLVAEAGVDDWGLAKTHQRLQSERERQAEEALRRLLQQEADAGPSSLADLPENQPSLDLPDFIEE